VIEFFTAQINNDDSIPSMASRQATTTSSAPAATAANQRFGKRRAALEYQPGRPGQHTKNIAVDITGIQNCKDKAIDEISYQRERRRGIRRK
jgi:hypothetical protein